MATEYDIFLSYATADNTTLAKAFEGQEGWVMCFKVALQQALDRQLGRKGDAQWFLDRKDLRTGDEFGPELKTALENSTVLLAVASNAYFNDDSWCKNEREHFVATHNPNKAKPGRIFGVLLEETALSLWKEKGFPGLQAFAFYEKDTATEKSMRLGEGEITGSFIRRIASLAQDIAKYLTQTKLPPRISIPELKATRGTVFLAAVPGEIEAERTELRESLVGANWRVIPEENVCNQDLKKCREESRTLAAQSVAFVQLLSAHPWKPCPYDKAQFEAVDKSTPIFRFRSDEIDLSQVREEEHRVWLQKHDTAARSMTAMKRELLAELEKIQASANAAARREQTVLAGDNGQIPDSTPSAFITVSVGTEERPTLGEKLVTRLKEKNVYAVMPDQSSLSFEECLLNENGLLTVFGNEPYERVEKALLEWRRLLLKHRPRPEAPPIGIYLSQPPPDDKRTRINMTLPGLRVLPWDNEQEFEQFIGAVRSYAQKSVAAI
jgi:hypothetical protein